MQVRDLDGEEIVVTGHRDGACYDRAVADTLAEFGVTPTLRRGGPGPALFAAVVDGHALALTTAPDAVDDRLVARPLDPGRTLSFELLWGRETPSPALTELIRTAEHHATRPAPELRPALRAVA